MKLEINPIAKQDAGSLANSEVAASQNLQNEAAAKTSEVLKRGIGAAKSGNRHDARTLLLRVTESDPKNETAWLWLASISEYPEELLVFLQNVLAINPENQRALDWTKQTKTLLAKNFVQRGIAASQENQKDSARQSFLQAIVHDNQNEMAWLWLASIVDSAEEKMSHLQKVLVINPENASAIASLKSIKHQIGANLLKKANHAFVSGDRKRAKALIEQTIKSDDSIEDAWILKAHLADSFDEKVSHFKHVLDLNPANQAAQSGLMSVESVMESLAVEAEVRESVVEEVQEQLDVAETAEAVVEETSDEAVENIELTHESEPETASEEVSMVETIYTEDQSTEVVEQHFVDEVVVEYQESEDQTFEVVAQENAAAEQVVAEENTAEFQAEENVQSFDLETAETDHQEPAASFDSETAVENSLESVSVSDAETLESDPETLTEESENIEVSSVEALDSEAVSENSSSEVNDDVETQESNVAAVESNEPNEWSEPSEPNESSPSFAEESETDVANVADSETPSEMSETVEVQASESLENEAVETSPYDAETEQESIQHNFQEAESAETNSTPEVVAEFAEETHFESETEQLLAETQTVEDVPVVEMVSEVVETSQEEIEHQQVESEVEPTENFEAVSEIQSESNFVEATSNSVDFAVQEEILDIKPVHHDNHQVGVYSFSKFGASETVAKSETPESQVVEESHEVENHSQIEPQIAEPVATFEEFQHKDDFAEVEKVAETVVTPEVAKVESVPEVVFESHVAEDSVYEYSVDCPFCETENALDFQVCVGCHATLDMSDLDAILGNTAVNSEVVFQSIQSMELDKLDGEFSDESYAELGMAYLNVKDLKNAHESLKKSLHLNPMNVLLNTLVKQIALKIGTEESHKVEEVLTVKNESRTIMVVDDSPTVRKLISSKLERHGHTVVSAIDGMDALAKINEITPDLILLDITMPKLDGYQVCKLIRNNDATKGIPVIMISGKDGFFDKVRGKMAGSNGFISKPFGPEILMKTLAAFTN